MSEVNIKFQKIYCRERTMVLIGVEAGVPPATSEFKLSSLNASESTVTIQDVTPLPIFTTF